jgi:hypothetical protein
MTPSPKTWLSSRRGDPISWAALLVATIALISSLNGQAPAERVVARAKPGKSASAKSGTSAAKLNKLKTHCPITNSVNLGSWCLESTPHSIPAADVGKNDYFYAAQTCVREGGWLPSAAQLIGAAPYASLQSVDNDSPATSGVEEFPEASRGIVDKREMTGDLFTTTAGAEAAGSEGVTAGSRGNTSTGEPDPVPAPANPEPETLDYVTVYDNFNHGGFAGGVPVTKPESFRCAYASDAQKKAVPSKEE